MPVVQPQWASASSLASQRSGTSPLRWRSTAGRLTARGISVSMGSVALSKLQPRLVFSMPNSAAAPVFWIPDGKCSPLMKRMEREVSGV